MWRYTFNFFLALIPWLAEAQQQAAPSGNDQNEQTGQLKPDWAPHDLKVGFNAIRSGRTLLGSDIVTHEIHGALAMHQLVVVLDFGIEEHDFGDGYRYQNNGGYLRFGGNWNFVKDKKSGNEFSLGLRYASAIFNDKIAYTFDQGFGTADYTFENTNLNARWIELTLNLRGRVVSNFYTGFTMRWQLMRKVNGEGQLKTFNVPGFGNTKRENSTAFDYYFMWKIPFRKEKQ